MEYTKEFVKEEDLLWKEINKAKDLEDKDLHLNKEARKDLVNKFKAVYPNVNLQEDIDEAYVEILFDV